MTEEIANAGRTAPPLVTRPTLLYRVTRLLCAAELKLVHRLSVRGRSNVPATGGVLLVSNHQSFLDIPVVAVALPKRHVAFVARETLARSRALALLMRECGAVLIKRGSADRKALSAMVEHLRAGDVVSVFPEGTRSSDGSVGEFHAGALFAAKRARAPIVPAGIRGAIDALPRDAKLPRARRIEITFGPPIDGDRKDAMIEARRVIVEMIGDGRLAS